jgi:carboxyl-terminal processing protease
MHSAFQRSSMQRLNKSLLYVHKEYVEPGRIDYSDMFLSACDELSQYIAEFTYTPTSDKAIHANVLDEKKEFSTQIASIYSLRNQITDLLKFISQYKESDINESLLEEIAIQGILKTLDPHSVFLSKEVLKETNVGIEGKFGGLGIVIGFRDGFLTVISPIDGTPASRAGVQAGDRIVKIEDEPTLGMTLTEAVSKMRGEEGTQVEITISRKGAKAEKDYKLTRAQIKIVNTEATLLSDNIGYIRLKGFDKASAQQLRAHIEKMKSESPQGELKGLIFDLRNNPGGLLDQSIAVADLFLPKGDIVSTVERGKKMNDHQYARKQDDYEFPMIVLINQGSASASEIVSGALKKNDRALLIGDTSFGKGTVQQIFPLPEQTALKLTVAQYLTTGEVSIQSIGISPDIQTHPVWVDDEEVRFAEFYEGRTEKTLDRHFVNKKALKDKPKFSMSYLLNTSEDDEDQKVVNEYQFSRLSPEKKQEQLFKSFEVKFAHEILQEATPDTQKGSQLYKLAQKQMEKIKKEQQQEIASALMNEKIDWTYPPQDEKTCQQENLVIETSIEPKAKTYKPGQQITLQTSVTNPGKCTLYQVRSATESGVESLNELHMYLGKLDAGQTVSQSKTITLDEYQPRSLAAIDFVFYDAHDKLNETRTVPINIEASNRPTFTITHQLFNQESKEATGNVSVGKKYRLKVQVKNKSEFEGKELMVTLKQKGDKTITLDQSRHTIESLASGKEASLDFSFRLNEVMDDALPLQIQLTDIKNRYVLSSMVNIPMQDAPEKGTKDLVTLIPPTIDVMDVKQDPKSRSIDIQGLLKDNEEVKDLYVFINGDKVYYNRFKTKQAMQKFLIHLPLEDEENDIQIVTRDQQDLQTGYNLLVHRN